MSQAKFGIKAVRRERVGAGERTMPETVRDMTRRATTSRRIMIIRHAEKPGDADPDHGVSLYGVHDKHDLTVRGWQRAGALVRFFAPIGAGGDPGISVPATIMASAATPTSPSLRAQHTVRPLAAALGIGMVVAHADGEEPSIAAAAIAAPFPVLIAWHHNHIVRLVRALGGKAIECPAAWPDDRFDLVWVLDQAEPATPWTFSQRAQRLLPGDRDQPI